ncbi:hypothetical protein C2845_PM11G13170 [Panicum miliaceum]|uniref:Uncharacterized protein n=1 Tax=Panicum miliaceum TaxID=4540 RepID=A0A3L6RWU6_PANMI|nr:hypothetical protein C2845_PM11G13170 [Panicum miliaceum]
MIGGVWRAILVMGADDGPAETSLRKILALAIKARVGGPGDGTMSNVHATSLL